MSARLRARARGRPAQLALLVLALAAGASLLQPAAGQLEADDGTALQDLAAGLGASLPSWSGTLPCSEGWERVTCCYSPVHTATRVCEVDLSGLGLSGTIPASFSSDALTKLDISSNNMTGVLPSLVLPSLSHLLLSSTQLSGNSTDGLQALCNNSLSLQVLDLRNNPGLQGAFPGCFSSLMALQQLRLSYTGLEGTLPHSWGSLGSLVRLDLAATGWAPHSSGSSAWPAWGGMVTLQWLDLSEPTAAFAPITDKLPADWFTGMGSLQTFMCANCNWAEAADPDMAAWQALSWLDLSGNPLQLGAVRADSSSANMLPAEWAPLNLLALKVRSCNLDEWNTSTLAAWELQPAQGLLRTLRILDVSINPGLAAADMEAFFGQMQLWELYIGGTDISGAGWANMPCLLDYGGNAALTASPPTETSTSGICHTNPWEEWSALLAWKQTWNQAPWLTGWDTANPGCPNGWTGVQCDPATGRVTGLDLSNIQLCFALNPCPLPTALLEQLSALDTLRLRGAGISGQLADLDLSILPRLRALDLSGNPGMLGPLPGDWPTSAPNLVSLELSGISGMGTLPATWVDGAWPNLTTLHLSGGGLSSVPSVWGLQALTQLDLSRNNLTGPLPAFNASGGTAQLQQLDFSNNALTGNLLAGLGATLPSLSVLLLSGNELSGTLPAEWGSSMTTLTWLDLSFNRLQGPLPGSWNQMGSLTNLTLSFNNFTGPLPSAWLDATVPHLQLQAFACAHCNLSGLMPPWGDPNTCGTEAMQHFNVSGNTLSGSVPDSMAAWGSLLSFDVSQNRLSGGVFGGGSTCDLLSLVTLKLAGNLFNGTIPADWETSLPALQVLDASDNRLSGSVPLFLATLPLQQLHLHANNLSGSLPPALNATPALHCLTLHANPGLCGPAPNGSTCFDKAGTQIGFNCSTGALLPAHYCVNAPEAQCSYVPPMSGQGLLLKAFRDSIGMNDLGTWSRGNPCTWRWAGVECDASGNVVALRLKPSFMSSWGPLNWDALANVTTLRVLELPRIYYDSIAWQYPLPQQLSRLASLEVLNVSGINMGGQLPESWAALRNLTHLDISSWQMGQRSLPLPWIYNLTSLQVLRAVNARIVQSLDDLRLGEPAAFFNLRVLLLGGNTDVFGTLPPSWSQRPLQVLGLNGTGIFGSLPPSWGDSVAGNLLRGSLQQQLLHNTAVGGSIPSSWTTGLPNVTVFTAWGTQLCGPHPANGTGLGGLCLDTTNTLLGTACGNPDMILAPVQQPPGCMSQPPSPYLASTPPMSQTNNTWDRDQLRLLKAALGHPPVLASWASPGFDMPCASPGRWLWLDCDAGGGVARLSLAGLGLGGPLPAQLWQLRMLEELDVSRNAFAGPIPANASTATWWRLAKLDMSYNALTGPLPANWSGLASLQQLDISGNNFTGNLPSEWGACGWPNMCMSGLKNLTCAGCGLSGSLPAGWQWMPLHTLVLPRNRITGGLPDSWAQLPGLSVVDLSFNNLSVVPHGSYFSGVNIQEAYLQGNALNGSLPTGWLNTRLERIDLSNNQITGPLPGWAMGEGPSLLQWVNLAHNRLSGYILDQWSINNGTLRELVFSHNPQLAGNISAWSLPRSLQALHIANTSIAGSLDGDWLSRQGPVLDCLVGYSTPGLCGGLVEGLPCSIVNFTDGTALGRSCSNPGISFVPPSYCRPSPSECLDSLLEARVLAAWKAALSDPAGRLASWTGLNPCSGWAGVTCDDNRTAVISLNVSGFGLAGPLTPALAQLAGMQVLDVSNNSLVGVLPESFLLLSQLEVLNVASNALAGTLPASYALLSSLASLNASSNALQGGLPPDWVRLPLQLLDLSFNQLSGAVPLLAWSSTGLGPLSATLGTLLLAGNALSGPLEQMLGFQALACWSVAGNPQLCGAVPVTAVCGNTTNTLLGLDCMTLTPLASNSSCVPASVQCVTLQQRSALPAPAPAPIGADAAALLALKTSVFAQDCSLDGRRCAIFDTWSPGLPPCSGPFCKACTLEHGSCGVFQPALNASTCNWRYLECNANTRVSKIVLDYGVVHSSGPRLGFGSLPGGLLANMSELEELRLKEHVLHGTTPLPPELGALPSLRVLHLPGPLAPGSSLPAEWGSLRQLQSLWLLDVSGLAGTLPASWGNMSSLASLRITGAGGVSGTIPAAWSSMASTLAEMQLSNMMLSGALATAWPGGLPRLTRLHISDTPLLLPANISGWASNGSMSALVLRNAPGLAGSSLAACGLDGSRAWPSLTRLELSGLGLVGTLPAGWQAALPARGLELLDVSLNALSGGLPPWLAELLATDAALDVSNNSFSGPLPAGWAGRPPLRLLRLAHNMLAGGIPDSWAWLVYSTSEVDVSNNRLEGAIPGSWFNTSLFTGAQPRRITSFQALNNPCLCGGVPGWLMPPTGGATVTSSSGTTTNSTSSINGTALNNTSTTFISSNLGALALACGAPEADAICVASLWAPEYLRDAWQLLALKAAAADASTSQRLASWRGTVPPCTNSSSTGTCVLCDDSAPPSMCGGPRPSDGALMCNWRFIACRDRRVVTINVAYMGLAFAFLPAQLANGTVLESLDLQHTSVLGGTLPSEYATWTNLTTFRLRGPVWGQLPLNYTAWSRLRAFELTSTALTGTIPPSYFSSWTALENFTLDGASISGHLPPPWGCPNLTSYIVQNTPVVSNASSPLWVFSPLASSLTRLTALGLGGTMLQLPGWTGLKDVLAANGWAVQLKAFSCPACGLSGPLGPLVPYFPSLAMLELSFNQLSGVIPPDLGGYRGLRYLSLSHNKMYGTLPPGLVGAFSPEFVYGLDLSQNLLTGGLPDAWGTAAASANTSFWAFQLQSNSLAGPIPDSWAHLIATSNMLDLSNLRLAGPLPPSLEAVMNSTAARVGNMSRSIRFANNPCLCGPVPALLKSITPPDAANGTQLERVCQANCTPSAGGVSVFSHPDWPALLLLRAAIVGGPTATLAALNTTWSNTTSRTPCHDIDPNCLACPLAAAATGGCASPIVGPGGRPSYFCNAAALGCIDGRVVSVNISHAGLVLSQLPAEVSQMAQLRHLGLEGIQLGNSALPNAWSTLSQLASLRLSANGTRVGALRSSWGLMPSLRELSLANLTVETAGLPSDWANLTSLQSLALCDLNLTGDGLMLPAAWGPGMRSLASLTLTRVRGLAAAQQLPDAWVARLPALTSLQLTDVGNLSSPLARYAQLLSRPSNASAGGLRVLVLSGLNLTGTIPATLLHTSWSLQHLSLARNQLTGAIDVLSWANATALRHVNLSRNALSGQLPAAWAGLRGANISIDVAFNNISGPLPAAWALAGADGGTLQLALLNTTGNALTGSLPASWANLSALAPTVLLLAGNQLTGGIPAEWGNRTTPGAGTVPGILLWSQLDVASNSRMCGLVPAWFYSGIALGNASLARELLQGTSLADACLPASFDHFLNTLGAVMPTMRSNVTLRLTSRAAPLSTSWLVAVQAPNSTVPQPLGPMQLLGNTSAGVVWSFPVPRSVLSMRGNFTFSVSSSTNDSTAVTNSPLVVEVFPAASAADASLFSVSMAPSAAVGGIATVLVQVNDVTGAPTFAPTNITLTITGSVSGMSNVTTAALTRTAQTGLYSYAHTALARERLSFRVAIDNATVSTDTTINITSTLPSAVHAAGSLAAATLVRDGDASRSGLAGPVPLLASLWHVLFVPVLRAGGGGGFFADPGLTVRLLLSAASGPNATNTSNTTAVNTTALVFSGVWSSTNGSYVVPFKLPSNGSYSGMLNIWPNASAAAFLANRSLTFEAAPLRAVAAPSSLSLITGARQQAGELVYVVARLLSALGRPATSVDNVRVTVQGNVSGVVSVPPLARQTDGAWALSFTPQQREALNVSLAVDGTLAGLVLLVLTAVSPGYVAYNTSLLQATLLSQGLAVSSPVASTGLSLLMYTGEASLLSFPLLDRAGNRVRSDLGLKVALSLVPADMEAAIAAKYNLTAQPLLSHRRRSLLQSANATSNTTSSTALLPPDWVYLADYASEAPEPYSTLEPAPLPPSYLLNTAALAPDAGNAIQDRLSAEAGVASFAAEFDAASGSYNFSLTPQVALPYLALMSVRHPNMSGSFALLQFRVAAAVNPASIVAPPAASSATNTSSTTSSSAAATVTAADVALFNALVNPRVSFVASFPRVSVAGFGGEAKLLAAYGAILAANGPLDGPNWVQAALVNSSSGATAINTTMWFPSTYASVLSPFEGLSGLDYYVFLLNKLPAVAFGSTTYAAFVPTNATVSNFTVALPGKSPEPGISYGTPPAASSTSTTPGAAAAAPPPAAITIVSIAAAELEVVVAAPAPGPVTSAASGAAAAAPPTPPPVDLTKIVDTTPPTISLVGDPFMSVLQADKFADPGATAYDNIDGNMQPAARLQLCRRPAGAESLPASDNRTLSCGATLTALNTSLPTPDSEVFVITYSARDAAGNRAAPLRRFVVVTARCAAPERWCPDLAACSVQGLCLRALTSASAPAPAAAAAAYVPPVDKTPPKLTLLGSGRAAVTATGAAIMMDNVTWKAAWADAGASAFDAIDGDLSGAIQSFGAGAVDTSRPTPPGREFSFVVEYAVEDKSRNAAPVARRLIRVVCPSPEAYCVDPDTSAPTCTVKGVCGAPALLSFSAASTSSGGVSAASMATTATSSAASSRAVVAAPAPPTPPAISLLVPGAVQITAGDVYDRCADNAPISAVCERGVAAEDAKDGNMERQVLVCGSRWRPAGNQRSVPVLLACNISSSLPGDYNITFSVTNSAGLSASVVRRVTIKAACPEGEALCPDQITCSQGGTCVSTPAAPAASASSSSGRSPAAAAAAAAAAKAPAPNMAPAVSLVTAPGFDAVVYVRRGSSYTPCKAGVLPLADSPCEPGANATDPDGLQQSGGSTAAADLTDRVVVCPPATCISRGCSPVELRRHYFSAKGLQGCGVDTSMPEGTQFKVDFWVWDSGTPVLNASVVRTVVLSPPCPSANAPHWCTDTAGRSFCSGSPCGTAQKLLPPAKPKPQVHLLHGGPAVYVQYGQPSPVYLGVCASGRSNASCGAVAWDVQPGEAGRVDLSPFLSVTQSTPGCDPSAGQSCATCNLETLASSGNCLPGSYLLTFSVANDDGLVATAQRRLVVYQSVLLTSSFMLYEGLANSSRVDAIVANAANSSSIEGADAVSLILSRLGPAAAALDASDVQVLSVSATQVDAANFSVAVNASIHVFSPAGVHRKDIQATAAAAGAAAGQRRLLAGAVTESGGSPCHGSMALHAGQPLLAAVHAFLQLLDGHASCTDVGGVSAAADSDAAWPGRRLLQASADVLQSSLQAVAGGLSSGLGAANVSSAITTPSVDLQAAYLSALTSSLQVLGQQLSALNATSTAMSGTMSAAFGDEAEQRESQVEVQLTNTYKDLVAAYDGMVTALSGLADSAAAKFDQQVAATATLSSALGSAITTMRESAALTQQLQQKYVEQTLMLQDATGTGVTEACNRTRAWAATFTINSSVSAAVAPAMRRRLLEDGGSAADAASTADELAAWQGYQVSLAAARANWAVDETRAPEQARYVGASAGHNKVVGGLFLHTTRKASTSRCNGTSLAVQLNPACQRRAVPLARNLTSVAAYLASLFGDDAADAFPYGVDPAFLRSSTSLYRPELQGRVGWFYNASDPLQVPVATGTPFGFFHQPVKGYAAGFPVLLPNRLSQGRAAAALQYLLDGNYLDRHSRQLTAELLTYNADLRVLGYTRMTFTWQQDGAITGFVDVRGVPAVASASEGGSALLAAWLVPLWLLCVVFWAMTAWEARELLSRYEGDRHWLKVLASSFDWDLSAVIALAMSQAVLLLTVFATATAPQLRPQAAYNMYDALSTSRARMFMPAKAYNEAVVAAGLAAAPDGPRSVLSGGQLPLAPGSAGRWLLPDASADWEAWASLMAVVHSMAGQWAAYTLLQGVVLVLLTLKLLRSWSFQAKLDLICNTLLRAAPQLAHLLFVILGCVALFAGLSYLGTGDRVAFTRGYGPAFEEVLRSLLGLAGMKLPDVLPRNVEQPGPARLLSYLIYYGRELLFVMVLMQFFMTTLGSVFMELKRRALDGPNAGASIPADLAAHVWPELRAAGARALRRRRRGGATGGADAEGAHGGAGDIAAAGEVARSTHTLQHFLRGVLPHAASGADAAAGSFGDKVAAVPVGGRWLDLPGLQQLLVGLALDGDSSTKLAQTGPARRYASRAAAVQGSSSGGSSGGGAPLAAADGGDTSAAAAALLLPEVGREAVAAGGAGPATAAALAAAEQLMASCGKAVDQREVARHRLDPGCLEQQLDEDVGAPELRPGHDFTLQDLHNVLSREQALHHQIYAAIWAAVAAMERWSGGVGRYLAKVTRETNASLADNARVMAALAGPGSAAAARAAAFSPLPVPKVTDLSQSLRPVAPAPALDSQQQQFGATVVVRAGGGGTGSSMQPRAQPALPSGAGDSPGPGEGKHVGFAADTAAAAAAGSSSGGRRPLGPHSSGVAVELLHSTSLSAGANSIRSPGGVSLHSRTPGAAAATPGSRASVLQQQPWAPAQGGAAAASDAASSSSSGSSSRPRSGSGHSNRVVPVTEHAGPVAAAVGADPDEDGGNGDGGELQGPAGSTRLPTISGKAPSGRLQPMH